MDKCPNRERTKRQFLQMSGALVAGSVFSDRLTGASRTNWAGNYTYKAERLDVPKSVGEVQQLVKSRSKIKALGARHSFNSIADSTGDQISLKNLDQMTLDPKSRAVTLGAGVTYGRAAPYLDERGYAFHNLASLPHVSVVGACSTATHGSGDKNGNLSTAVSALQFVTADGDLVDLSRDKDGDNFRGAVVGLGGLSVVTGITLDVQPTYQVRQAVYENLSFDQIEKHLDEIFASGYSVSLFTDWQQHRATQVWIKRRGDEGGEFRAEFFGAKLSTKRLHPLAGHSAENCTEQMGIPGPWYERLPHFRMNFTPSSGAELQSEYFVPRDQAIEAIQAVEKLRDHITPHLFITELRSIHQDDFWMSPCYKRSSMAIHFTWKPEWPEVKQVLPMIEENLKPFHPRPHWAKLFTMPAATLQGSYEKLPEFRQMMAKYDRSGKFRNEFLSGNLYGAAVPPESYS
jgi:xylitol oxidase